MTVTQQVRITPEGVTVNGRPLPVDARGTSLLTALYRAEVNDYPRFFKMDPLSKLGFLASELLLKADGSRHADSADRAVILFGRSGSLCCDRSYQQTIERADDYFPSPSLFVCTLPNIVTGEIALRNGYHGETAFYLLEHRDEQLMRLTVEAALHDGTASSVVCGWIDYASDTQFVAELELNIKD